MEYIINDGGRAAAGYKGKAGDCATRALAIASGMDYSEAYRLINQYSAQEKPSKNRRGISSARTGVHSTTFQKLMADLGWHWTPTMFIGQGCKVHLKAEELPKGNIIVNLSRHYSAVIDGVIHDTFDPSRHGTRCVYGYWRQQWK